MNRMHNSIINAAMAVILAGSAPAQILQPYAVLHTVANLDKSTAFYRDVVGLRVNTAAPTSTTFNIPGSDLHLVIAQSSGSGQNPVESRIQDPGVVKFVLRVRDIDKAFDAVRKNIKSVYSTGGGPVHPEGPEQSVRAVIVKDPDGFALEFVLANANAKTTAPADSNIVGGWASLVVEDLDQTLRFYGEQLGFKINAKRQLPPSTLALEGTPDASVVNVGTRPPGFDGTWFIYDFRNIDRRKLNSRLQDPGASAISFLTSDLPALLNKLKQAGFPADSAYGTTVVRDPSGIPIELIEKP
jgi:catechol 2,3-dioxygenase-like lactoylglutathione lyase family enzyme